MIAFLTARNYKSSQMKPNWYTFHRRISFSRDNFTESVTAMKSWNMLSLTTGRPNVGGKLHVLCNMITLTQRENLPHLWQPSLHVPWYHQPVVHHSTAEPGGGIHLASVSVHTTDQWHSQNTHSEEPSHCVHSSYSDSHQDHTKIFYKQYIIIILQQNFNYTCIKMESH